MRLVRMPGMPAPVAAIILALLISLESIASIFAAETASMRLRLAQTTADDKIQSDKAGVPATVVDGQQLESVLGIKAVTATGEDMGRIVDIVVERTGRVRAAIIDFGGFLGVGSRQIAVDWEALRFDPKKKAGGVVVNLTKDQLRVAPIYKPGEPVVVIGSTAKP